jgi:hypothetical protein
MKKTMITIFFTEHKLIVLSILPKERKFGQLSFVHDIFLDLRRETRILIVGSRRRLLGRYGQFNVLSWIRSGIKIREASCFIVTAPTLFAMQKPLRLLALWNVEVSLEKSRV